MLILELPGSLSGRIVGIQAQDGLKGNYTLSISFLLLESG